MAAAAADHKSAEVRHYLRHIAGLRVICLWMMTFSPPLAVLGRDQNHFAPLYNQFGLSRWPGEGSATSIHRD